MKIRKFIDQVVVNVRSGNGGDGSGTFRREAFVPFGGPDGGDGGRGGHVIFRGSHDVGSLINLYFAPQLFAENGVSGSSSKKHGRNGEDLIVEIPCGTEIYNAETNALVADIVDDGEQFQIATGGEGGLGNVHFKSSTHQAPTEHTPGKPGQDFRLRLELKTIADAGLIGFPNAGKSSLLQCVSAARPRVAGYPFTTLNPIVGVIEYDDFSQLKVADIPGIVEGAASGVGLGLRFLKHISRSTVLVYVVDMAGTDNREPWQDYLKLRAEVRQYDAAMLDKPYLVIANKMDVQAARENLPRFVEACGVTPLPLSAIDSNDDGVARFKQTLRDILKPSPKGEWNTGAADNQELNSIDAQRIAANDSADYEFIHEDALKHASFLDFNTKKSISKKRIKRGG